MATKRVDFEKFLQAVSKIPKMKRSPHGARGNIPKDTILTFTVSGVLVETPVLTTFVKGSGQLTGTYSFGSQNLLLQTSNLLRRIKKGEMLTKSILSIDKNQNLKIKNFSENKKSMFEVVVPPFS